MSPTTRVRQIVRERDSYTCQRCGKYLGVSTDYSLQHRRARGMGGSRQPETDQPANLVTLCGSATSPDGCHYWAESHPLEALATGLRVSQGHDPETVPVLTHRGWLLLSNDGTYTEVEHA